MREHEFYNLRDGNNCGILRVGIDKLQVIILY